jgi:hypothetical protein
MGTPLDLDEEFDLSPKTAKCILGFYGIIIIVLFGKFLIDNI